MARGRARGCQRAARHGVIALEVEKVFPELVTTDEQGLKKVEYEGLIAPLIEAVKELDDRVRTLEAKIGALRSDQKQD